MKTEQYRFINASLYEYDVDSNSYIHVFKQANCRTKARAIREYKEQLLFEQQVLIDSDFL